MSNITIDKPLKASNLSTAWAGVQKAKPGIRIREAAKELGVSEAELLATKINNGVTRLSGPWAELLKSLPGLGRVMSLTRNDACILENRGSFQKVNVMGEGDRAMATVIGPIESRVFFKAWHVAFAVTETKLDRVLQSIQVFDQSGEAVTKIYLQEQSNGEAYTKIVDHFRAVDQTTDQVIEVYEREQFSNDVNTLSLLADWSVLKDTHDFFGMLRKHKADRYHALEIASGKFTYQVDAKVAPKQLLDEASASKLPIMIFAGNRGNLQIHQGKVKTIRVLDHGHTGNEHWLNVLDPDFNMHLKQNNVHTAWVVEKPTTDGTVTSVELFDKEKQMIVQFFGLRKPGIAENTEWKTLVERLPKL